MKKQVDELFVRTGVKQSMKMILMFLAILYVGGVKAQPIYSNRAQLVYDTAGRTAEEKEKIMALERVLDSIKVLPITQHPDEKAKYRLLFKGRCLSRSYMHDTKAIPDPDDFQCGLEPVSSSEYSPWALAMMGNVTVYGEHYALVNTLPVIWHGDIAIFTEFCEYFLERIE